MRYRANIAAAYAALQLQNNIAARTALEDAPDEHRNWEWQYLQSQQDGARLVLTVPIKRVDSVVLSPSGRQIAVGGIVVDADLFLYEVASGKLDAVLHSQSAAPASFGYRADGKQIASIGNDEGGNTGQLLAVLRGHTGAVRHVVFGPLGTRVVTAADDAHFDSGMPGPGFDSDPSLHIASPSARSPPSASWDAAGSRHEPGHSLDNPRSRWFGLAPRSGTTLPSCAEDRAKATTP